jgi:hypothetical protein
LEWEEELGNQGSIEKPKRLQVLTEEMKQVSLIEEEV